jgi:hypothetical protein
MQLSYPEVAGFETRLSYRLLSVGLLLSPF